MMLVLFVHFKPPKLQIMKKTAILLFALLSGFNIINAQSFLQKGLDIDGEFPSDNSGWSVSMPDSNTVAIGAIQNDGNGLNSGHVRIFQWNGNAWVQKGLDIDGEASENLAGYSVSMPDNNIVAIGARGNDGNGNFSGHVRIYRWNGTSWLQKGSDIDGEGPSDQSGYSICMPDSNTVAIGAPFNDGNGWDAGHVRIYQWNPANGGIWMQKGMDIDGEAVYDNSGLCVSMPDSNTVAIGASNNDGNGSKAGHVRIYRWNPVNNGTWVQKGIDIDGEAAGDESGMSISMPDSNTVGIGAMGNDGNGNLAGHVRIYRWNPASGGTWLQKGIDIDGEASIDVSGCSVSMPDSNTIAIGARANDGNGNEAGHVRVYHWNGSVWVQKGIDIDGEAPNDGSGFFVSMPNSQTVAIGAPSSGGGNFTGHTRVFSFVIGVSIQEIGFDSNLTVYPNPVNGKLVIHSPEGQLEIINSFGQLIRNYSLTRNENTFDLSDLPNGIYILKLNTGNSNFTEKIILNH